MGADEFMPVKVATEDYPVDFPDSSGIDPSWEEFLAAAIAEDGVPDDDE